MPVVGFALTLALSSCTEKAPTAERDQSILEKAQKQHCAQVTLQKKEWNESELKAAFLCLIASAPREGDISTSRVDLLKQAEQLSTSQFTQTRLWIQKLDGLSMGQSAGTLLRAFEKLPKELGQFLSDANSAQLLLQPGLSEHYSMLAQMTQPLETLIRGLPKSVQSLPSLSVDSDLYSKALMQLLSLKLEQKEELFRLIRPIFVSIMQNPEAQSAVSKFSGSLICSKQPAVTGSVLPMTLMFVAQNKNNPEMYYESFAQSYSFWAETCGIESLLSRSEVRTILNFVNHENHFNELAEFGALIRIMPQENYAAILTRWGASMFGYSATNGNLIQEFIENGALFSALDQIKTIPLPAEQSQSLYDVLKFFFSKPSLLTVAIEVLAKQGFSIAKSEQALQLSPALVQEWQSVVLSLGGAPVLQSLGEVMEKGHLHATIMEALKWAGGAVSEASANEATPTLVSRHSGAVLASRKLKNENPIVERIDCLKESSHPQIVFQCLNRAGVNLPFSKPFLDSPLAKEFFSSFLPEDAFFKVVSILLSEGENSPLFKHFFSALAYIEGNDKALFDLTMWFSRGHQVLSVQEKRLVQKVMLAAANLNDGRYGDGRWIRVPLSRDRRLRAEDFSKELKAWASTNFLDNLIAWMKSPDFKTHWKAFAQLAEGPDSLLLQLDRLLWNAQVEPIGFGESKYFLRSSIYGFVQIQDEQGLSSWIRGVRWRISAAEFALKATLQGGSKKMEQLQESKRLFDSFIEKTKSSEVVVLAKALRMISSGLNSEGLSKALWTMHKSAIFLAIDNFLKAKPNAEKIHAELGAMNEDAWKFFSEMLSSKLRSVSSESWAMLANFNAEYSGLPTGYAMSLVSEVAPLLSQVSKDGVVWLFDIAEIGRATPAAKLDPILRSLFAMLSLQKNNLSQEPVFPLWLQACAEFVKKPGALEFLTDLSAPNQQKNVFRWIKDGHMQRILEWSTLMKSQR